VERNKIKYIVSANFSEVVVRYINTFTFCSVIAGRKTTKQSGGTQYCLSATPRLDKSELAITNHCNIISETL